MVNVHPALLPAFGGRGMYGNRVHHAVIESGARVSGVTVHFVDTQYDHGAIIAQWPVPVFASDDAGTLAARVLRVEHILYPRVIDAVAAGRLSLASRPVSSISADTKPAFTLLPHEDSRLAENIELAALCQRARDRLQAAPCDLLAAGDAVRLYQRAVLSLSGGTL